MHKQTSMNRTVISQLSSLIDAFMCVYFYQTASVLFMCVLSCVCVYMCICVLTHIYMSSKHEMTLYPKLYLITKTITTNITGNKRIGIGIYH